MDDFYMFVVGGIGVLLVCAYVIFNSLLGFRSKTTNRFMRVLILGIIAYFVDGGLSTFLWLLTYLYGIYVVMISVMMFIFGKTGQAANGLGINGKSILNVIIGYVAADRIVDLFKRK
ncbi:hypothetical protein [Virgibacillus alimentarius]|uniref:hypothetical protein n=1 Tax=Virgibacillus alimentarius TaxID=698769 RepID=UPI0004933D0C|nr:hypothetical protein [Virgibacillus alimentarius]